MGMKRYMKPIVHVEPEDKKQIQLWAVEDEKYEYEIIADLVKKRKIEEKGKAFDEGFGRDVSVLYEKRKQT